MSNGRAFVSAWRRWLSTTWKMSPALMYSLHLTTASSKAPGAKFEVYGRCVSPSGDRLAYLRATEALTATNVLIDTACRQYAEAVAILGGLGSLTEAARHFVRQQSGIVNKSVPDAVNELIAHLVQLREFFHLLGRHIGSHIVSQKALVGGEAHPEAWAR